MLGPLILIIEDNALNRKLVRDVLQINGYEILETETAEAGLEIARARHPALVLMDIQLPGMDGISATRLLRSNPVTQDIPVIAITASVMRTQTVEMMSAGFDGIQTKPISVTGLLDDVRRVLDQRMPSPPMGAASTAAVPSPALPPSARAGQVLVVDDTPQNVKLLADLLRAEGYRVSTATSGPEALASMATDAPDIVLVDVMMPGMSGYELCRHLRNNEATSLLPVVLVTALDALEERVKGLDAGADDFLTKPVNAPEMLARVRSLLRIRTLHETVRRQAAELEEWNRDLATRVETQLVELGRLGRLKGFFSAPVADLIARDDETLLQPHRRAVTVVGTDLRGFTAFAESSEPEEVMGVLREYHREMGRLITTWGGTLAHFAGDGIMVVFNDPVEVPNPEERAVRMTLAMRDAVETLRLRWVRQGFDLGIGFGISSGYATAGVIGFDQRWEYTVIGTVMNQAARLAGAATHGQILVSERLLAVVESFVEAEPLGELTLKGLRRPLATFNLSQLIGAA